MFEKIHHCLWYGFTVYKIFNLRILLVLHYIWKSFKYLSAFRYVFLFQLVIVCFRNLNNIYLSVSVKGKMYLNALKCNFKKKYKKCSFPHYKVMLFTICELDLPFKCYISVLRRSRDIHMGKRVRCDYIRHLTLLMIGKISLIFGDFGDKECHGICKQVICLIYPV